MKSGNGWFDFDSLLDAVSDLFQKSSQGLTWSSESIVESSSSQPEEIISMPSASESSTYLSDEGITMPSEDLVKRMRLEDD